MNFPPDTVALWKFIVAGLVAFVFDAMDDWPPQ